MKKVFASIICCLLVLCTVFMTGCTFSGDYVQATPEQFEELCDKIEDAEFSFEGGFSYKLSLKSTVPGQQHQVDFTVKAINDGGLQSKGCLQMILPETAETPAVNIKTDYWYKDGVIYEKLTEKESDTQLKTKSTIDFDAYLDTYFDVVPLPETSLSVLEYIVSINELGGTPEIYIAEEEELTKLKIRLVDHEVVGEQSENLGTITLTVIFVYDKDYNLSAFKYDIVSKTKEGKVKNSVVLEPWNANVSLPKDVEEYIDLDDVINPPENV